MRKFSFLSIRPKMNIWGFVSFVTSIYQDCWRIKELKAQNCGWCWWILGIVVIVGGLTRYLISQLLGVLADTASQLPPARENCSWSNESFLAWEHHHTQKPTGNDWLTWGYNRIQKSRSQVAAFTSRWDGPPGVIFAPDRPLDQAEAHFHSKSYPCLVFFPCPFPCFLHFFMRSLPQ